MPQGPSKPHFRAGRADVPSPGSLEGGLLALLPDLRRYSRSLTRSDADGEDLLQDAVERVLSSRAAWSGINLRGWALTIMTNLYRNGTRRIRRFPEVEIAEAEDIATPDMTGDPLERARLARALEALSPDHRAVLMLVVIEGYAYAEVAAMLKVPVGTIMSRLARAREHLGKRLAEDNIVPIRRSE
ncbi:RNA polymerase sigma factor [Rhizobium sp. KVB221]|uniref:RNA polymerase sigma factor n=1 Tax=Rhizobium setariae TaxID=2801340 RepID=A0A936YPM9_9HYPH|nr:RNA polymerase sigma factor [Rhizobium setariae]MBL0374398.1 RNA polymerase sigma factor [Rhizobium setariae]